MSSTVLPRIVRFLLSAALAASFISNPTPAAAGEVAPILGEALQEEAGTQPNLQIKYSGCARVENPSLNETYEQRILELVNQRRAENGLPPVKRNSDLDYAARYQAKDMMVDDYFNHSTLDRQNGSLVTVCSFSQRLDNYYTNWNYRAENIAAGYGTPEDTMAAWMNSDGHRANILSSSVREIGIGFMQTGGYYSRYWVQDFGRSPNVYPILINQDTATTDRAEVNLFIYGQGTWNEMRLRSDTGTWTNWMPFQQTYAWTLPEKGGQHTVSVELRNSGGTTVATSSDSILVLAFLPYSAFLPNIRR